MARKHPSGSVGVPTRYAEWPILRYRLTGPLVDGAVLLTAEAVQAALGPTLALRAPAGYCFEVSIRMIPAGAPRDGS